MYTAYTGIHVPVISNMTYKVQFQNDKLKMFQNPKQILHSPILTQAFWN